MLAGAAVNTDGAAEAKAWVSMPETLTVVAIQTSIAECEIDRPQRYRIDPRVVKIKMSNFKRQTKSHPSTIRNLEDELQLLKQEGGLTDSFTGIAARQGWRAVKKGVSNLTPLFIALSLSM
jgi:hypothetical protein